MTVKKNLPQIRILHLSDIHFGKKHNCLPPDSSGSSAGVSRLEDLLCEDLTNGEWAHHLWGTSKEEKLTSPLIVAITGDITQEATGPEYSRAYHFLSAIIRTKLLSTSVPINNCFIVPGNHDVHFDEKTIEERFKSYCTFYNKLFNKKRKFIQPHEAKSLTQVHIRDNLKLCVIEINSCLYVEKETIDESRGQVDLESIAELRKELQRKKRKIKNYLKIALIHHHPILIPTFVEPGRGYDAVLNSGSLLRLLRDEGVHLILHGHKHYPQVFTYDPESAWSLDSNIPQLVVAGGSCGSRELPHGKMSCNTYNLLTLKWDPSVKYARIHVITRGLIRLGDEGPLDPDQWKWKTIRLFDKVLGPFKTIPEPNFAKRIKRSKKKKNDLDDIKRSDCYEMLRYNMPVAELMPSLLPGQAYEVRVWLEPHKRKHKEYPVKVTWSSGPWFDRKLCDISASPDFSANFHYWGPMLIQAELEFEDGNKEYGYVYARLPESKAV